MRVVVRQKALKGTLRRVQWLLFAGSASLLAYCGFVVMDARVFQREERHQLDQLLAEKQAARPIAGSTSAKESATAVTAGLIGRIEIPSLDLSVIIMEGISRTTLRRAVGHIPGTALPGEPGNVGISGHRDTFFRPLRNIQQNDVITLTTLLGEYRYRVVSIKVVGPSDVAVLDPSGNEILTLVTCYPFYFVGAAPERYIVRAERVV